MDSALMRLRILLPFRVFLEQENVSRIVVDTNAGSYGFLPHRRDCVAVLVPGIITCENASGAINYVALDEGILIKTGSEVLVSVRNAIKGSELGKLHEAMEKEFLNLDESEKNIRTVLAKLESSFIQTLEKFRRD